MRYFIGFLVTIGLIILIIVLLVTGGSPTPAVKQVNLNDYSSNGTVQLLASGPIIADTNHQELEIDVSSSQVAITLYQGYQRTIVHTKSYPNNSNAYGQFLFGLQRAGFANGNSDKSLADDRGYCVDGTRYDYTFNNGSKDLFHYWSTTCGQKTFKGNINTTLYLLENQIPDFNDQVKDVNFNV